MKNTYHNHYRLIFKQFEVAVTFPTGYNGIFLVTSENNKFNFAKSDSDEDGFIEILIPKNACDLESVNKEIKRIIIEEEHYNEAIYRFTMKPTFSTLGSIIEVSSRGPIISFLPDDSIRHL